MYSVIAHHKILLLDGDDNLLQALVLNLVPLLFGENVLRQHLHALSRGQDCGSADEDGAERALLVARNLARQVRLERVDLRAEKVAIDGDVKAPQELLTALLLAPVDVVGEEDETRARSPNGASLGGEVSKGLEEVPAPGDVRHGGTLPSRDDESTAPRELLSLPNLHSLSAGLHDVRAVFGEAALQGEHANLRLLSRRHARVGD